MPQTPSSPPGAPATFSEQEIPTRVRATMPWRDAEEEPARDERSTRGSAAMGESLDSKTTSVPVDMLEAALAESRGGATIREEKSGPRKRIVEREAFSVHEAETKKASGIQLRRALASSAEGAAVDQLLADVATVASIPAQPEPERAPTEAAIAPPPQRSVAKAIAIAFLALVLASLAALLFVGKGSPRAGLAVVRGKLAAR